VTKELMEKKGQVQYKIYSYFNQPFGDIRWPYTSAREINKIIDLLKDKNSSGCDEINKNYKNK